MSLRSVPIWETSRMATDAMDTAVGSVFLRESSCTEWLAFSLTVEPILDSLKNRIICWHVDNMNVRQAWLNSRAL